MGKTKFSKHIVCIDTETTGLDRKTCRILQLSATKFDPTTGKHIETKSWYIKPSGKFEIEESAIEIHQITKEFIMQNGVSLSGIFKEFMDFKEGCDILSYNGTTYDFPILERDFEREGLDPKLDEHRYFDSFHLEKLVNSNSLGSCYKRYTGKDIENAHNATADVDATITVFMAQMKRLNDSLNENGVRYIDESFETTTKNTVTSPEGWLVWTEDGRLVFNQGKYKQVSTNHIVETDPGYIKWMMSPSGDGNNVATLLTKRSMSKEWNKYKKDKNIDQNSKNQTK